MGTHMLTPHVGTEKAQTPKVRPGHEMESPAKKPRPGFPSGASGGSLASCLEWLQAAFKSPLILGHEHTMSASPLRHSHGLGTSVHLQIGWPMVQSCCLPR